MSPLKLQWKRFGSNFSRRFEHILLHTAGLVSAALYFYLSLLSRQDNPVELPVFYSLLGGVWLLLLGLLYFYFKSGYTPKLKTLLIWALIFRLAGLVAEPVYEDDYYRFLWDGWVFSETGNPYGVAPIQYFSNRDIPHEMAHALERVNNPDVPTIYGPTLQIVFLLSHWVAPGSLTVLKLFFLFFDLSLLILMARFVKPRNLLFFAWCPLLIFETFFNAHPDIVGVALLAGACFCGMNRRISWAVAFCAAAASVKLIALLALPFLLSRGSRIKGVALFILVFGLLHAPFLIHGGMAEFDGLLTFSKYWEFNSAIYGALAMILKPEIAKPICLVLILTGLGLLWIRWQKSEKSTPPLDSAFGILFLCSPVINPWYLLWLAPFAAMRPRFWSLAALIVVSLSYLTGMNLGDHSLGNFEHPLWVRPVEFGIIAAALVLDVVNKDRAKIHDLGGTT